ncbi:MAG: transposase [Acidobacteriota bacterium]
MIVSIPEEFLSIANEFKECFTEPQVRHFCRYVWGLIIGEGGRNIQDIAAAYLEATDQSSLNNFICDSTWSRDKVRDKRIELVNRAIGRHVRRDKPLLFVLDDIVITKSGRCMQGAGYFYSNTERRTVWAHNFVSSFLVADHLRMTVEALEKKAAAASGYRGVKVVNYPCYATRPLEVYIPDVSPAQVVFSKARISSEQKRVSLEEIEPKATATSSLTWSKTKILTLYAKRSLIENGYRDEKQNLGLGQYQVRKTNSILRHAELVFCAHPLLVLMNLRRKRGQRFRTLGQMCQWAKQLQMREAIAWAYKKWSKGESLNDVLDILSL